MKVGMSLCPSSQRRANYTRVWSIWYSKFDIQVYSNFVINII